MKAEFIVREPSGLNEGADGVELVRVRNRHGDVWLLSWDELMDLRIVVTQATNQRRSEG